MSIIRKKPNILNRSKKKGLDQLTFNNTFVHEEGSIPPSSVLYQCTFCDRKLTTKQQVIKHIKTVHNSKETFDILPCHIKKIIHLVRSGECQNHLQEVGQRFKPDSGVNPELNHPVSGECKNHLQEVRKIFRRDSGVYSELKHPVIGECQNLLQEVEQNFRPNSGVKPELKNP